MFYEETLCELKGQTRNLMREPVGFKCIKEVLTKIIAINTPENVYEAQKMSMTELTFKNEMKNLLFSFVS